MNRDELASIKWYTDYNYEDLNEKLRKNYVLTSEQQQHMNNLIECLSRFRTKEKMIVYRGVKKILKNDSHKIFQKDQELKAFTSTSLIKEVALEFAGPSCCLMEIEIPKGSCALELGHLSEMPSESEVLIPPGGTFMYSGDDEDYTKNYLRTYYYTYISNVLPEEEEKKIIEKTQEEKEDPKLHMVGRLVNFFHDEHDIYDDDALEDEVKLIFSQWKNEDKENKYTYVNFEDVWPYVKHELGR
jgi:hypothetical protein